MADPLVFHPVPFTTEIVFRGDHEADPRVTVLHYRRSTLAPSPTEADLAALAGQARDIVLFRLRAAVSNQTQWTSITATDIATQFGASYTLSLNPPLYGLRNDVNILPGNVNVALSKKVNARLRGANGRLFVPDLIESDQTDSVLTGVIIDVLTNLAIAMLQRLVDTLGNNHRPVVGSKTHNIYRDITGVTFDTVTDSLRPRLKYHRRHRRPRGGT